MNQVIAKIEIIYDGSNLAMNGPMHDKIMCLGMLELAKQIVLSANQPKTNLNLGPFPMPNTNGKDNHPS